MMRTFSVFLLAATCLGAQQTWVVNNAPGAVADFTDLPQAVAAAAAGDIIYVVYTNNLLPKYRAPTIDKPLALMGVAQASSQAPGPTYAIIEGLLSIEGIPAGQHVLVSNLLLAPAAGMATNGLSVQGCWGDVVLEDFFLFAAGVNGAAWSNWMLEVSDCANVTVRGSNVYFWGSAFRISNSTVLLATSRVEGAVATFDYYPGSAALHLIHSTVTLIDCLVSGLGLPNPGALIDHSTLRVGPSTVLEGDYLGGTGPGSYWLGYQVIGGPGTGSVIELDPRGLIREQPSTVGSQQPISTRIDAVLLAWVTANRDFTVFVAGPPGGFALLMLGDLIPPTPTPFGDLCMHPATAFAISFEPMELPYDMHLWTLHCPPGAPVATGFALQALTLSPNGEIALTVPAPFTVAWQPGTVP